MGLIVRDSAGCRARFRHRGHEVRPGPGDRLTGPRRFGDTLRVHVALGSSAGVAVELPVSVSQAVFDYSSRPALRRELRSAQRARRRRTHRVGRARVDDPDRLAKIAVSPDGTTLVFVLGRNQDGLYGTRMRVGIVGLRSGDVVGLWLYPGYFSGVAAIETELAVLRGSLEGPGRMEPVFASIRLDNGAFTSKLPANYDHWARLELHLSRTRVYASYGDGALEGVNLTAEGELSARGTVMSCFSFDGSRASLAIAADGVRAIDACGRIFELTDDLATDLRHTGQYLYGGHFSSSSWDARADEFYGAHSGLVRRYAGSDWSLLGEHALPVRRSRWDASAATLSLWLTLRAAPGSKPGA